MQKAFPQRSLGYRCTYTEKPLQNTLCYKACTKHVPALLCTTKLAQSTPQHYFAPESLYKVRPNTTLYYKAYTKHCAALLRTTKLARSTSQYHFVLHSLHKARPSITYFVLQSLYKAHPSTTLYYSYIFLQILPSTTLHYKTCITHVPVLLCTTKLAKCMS